MRLLLVFLFLCGTSHSFSLVAKRRISASRATLKTCLCRAKPGQSEAEAKAERALEISNKIASLKAAGKFKDNAEETMMQEAEQFMNKESPMAKFERRAKERKEKEAQERIEMENGDDALEALDDMDGPDGPDEMEGIDAPYAPPPGEGSIAAAGREEARHPRDGEELLRLDLPRSDAADRPALAAFLEEWAAGFARPGSGLTTAVRVRRTSDAPSRIAMAFVPQGNAYADVDKDEDEGWESGAPEKKRKKEGGVEIIVEDASPLQTRLVRCNMSDDTVVKEMSEATLVERLKKDAKIWLKTRPTEDKDGTDPTKMDGSVDPIREGGAADPPKNEGSWWDRVRDSLS